MGQQPGGSSGFFDAPPSLKTGDLAHHGGELRLIDHLTKFRSAKEQRVIDLLFQKLRLGDLPGLERSLRNRTCASLRKRGVLKVERAQ